MSKKIIAAGALSLCALAAVLTFQGAKAPAISPQEVFTWDCEIPEQKPEAITFTCADGGMYVDRIDWSRWDESRAEGEGFYNVNDCDPNCAEGTMHEMPVRIWLSDLVKHEGKQYLRTLEINSISGENLPESRESSLLWDVMEFAEMIGDLR